MREDFPSLLRMYRERTGRSRNELAREVGVDPSYVSRMELGEREPPRQHVVEDLARALRLGILDRNRLLMAAGYAPMSLTQLGSWDEALQEVTDVLNDSRLTAEEREEFRQVVRLIAKRWRGRSGISPELAS
jgi:transcriptional regulator with XRE-family HTH domain